MQIPFDTGGEFLWPLSAGREDIPPMGTSPISLSIHPARSVRPPAGRRNSPAAAPGSSPRSGRPPAPYELVYDLEEIEQQLTASGTMVKANSSNTVYLDLSEADSIIYYEQASGGIPGLVDRLENLVSGLLS